MGIEVAAMDRREPSQGDLVARALRRCCNLSLNPTWARLWLGSWVGGLARRRGGYSFGRMRPDRPDGRTAPEVNPMIGI